MNDDKLQRFRDAVYGDIDEKVSGLLKEAEEEKKIILSEAVRKSEEAAERSYNDNTRKNAGKYVSDITKAEFNMKKELLKYRENLADRVFEAVTERILEYRNTPEYAGALVRLLLSCGALDNSEVYLSPSDIKHSGALKKAAGCEIAFSPDESVKLGGLSAYNKDKGFIINKTFDSVVEERRRLFTSGSAFYKEQSDF